MEDKLIQDAEIISNQLRTIRKMIKHSADRDIAGSGLTVPQISVLKTLSRDDGQSLKDLSNDLGLSHSTVSGIVDRLERRKLVVRRIDEQDKRIARVFLTDYVHEYLKQNSTQDQLAPLTNALQRATEAERIKILEALETLVRLLESSTSNSSSI